MSLSIYEEVMSEVNKETRTLANDILNRVVQLTPVDTGMAQGNWKVTSENAPRVIEELRSAREAITSGRATIQSVISSRSLSTIVISNNLPYIERLNQGWSARAPFNFVELAIQAAVNK